MQLLGGSGKVFYFRNPMKIPQHLQGDEFWCVYLAHLRLTIFSYCPFYQHNSAVNRDYLQPQARLY